MNHVYLKIQLKAWRHYVPDSILRWCTCVCMWSDPVLRYHFSWVCYRIYGVVLTSIIDRFNWAYETEKGCETAEKGNIVSELTFHTWSGITEILVSPEEAIYCWYGQHYWFRCQYVQHYRLRLSLYQVRSTYLGSLGCSLGTIWADSTCIPLTRYLQYLLNICGDDWLW